MRQKSRHDMRFHIPVHNAKKSYWLLGFPIEDELFSAFGSRRRCAFGKHIYGDAISVAISVRTFNLRSTKAAIVIFSVQSALHCDLPTHHWTDLSISSRFRGIWMWPKTRHLWDIPYWFGCFIRIEGTGRNESFKTRLQDTLLVGCLRKWLRGWAAARVWHLTPDTFAIYPKHD